MRRHSLCGISMAFAALLVVSASTFAEDAPSPFPRDGAKKLKENDRVVFWEVTWEKGNSTGMQTTQRDLIYITMEEGGVKVTRPDKTSTTEFDRFGSVGFEPKGTARAQEGVSDKPRRAIVVELKPLASAKKIEIKTDGLPNTFPRPMTAKLFETDQVNVWDDRWEMGRAGMLHAHYTDLAWVFLEAGELHSISAKGVSSPKNTVRVKGEVAFSARMEPHQEQAVKGPPRAIILEFKYQ